MKRALFGLLLLAAAASAQTTVTVTGDGAATVVTAGTQGPAGANVPAGGSTGLVPAYSSGGFAWADLKVTVGTWQFVSVPSFRIHIPDQVAFPGSMALGTGGTSLINSGPFSHTGEGSEFFGLEAGDANTDAAYNTFVGYRAGKRATTGSQNTFLGMAAGEYMTTGTGNTFIGAFAGQNATGDHNVIIGTDAGNEFTTAQDSVAIGRNAGGEVKAGNGNTYIGADAGSANENSTGNTCVGMFCLLLGTGSNNIALGYTAGRWETGNYKLFIDGYSRNDEADARAKSLIYGIMGANVADQTMNINALHVNVGDIATYANNAAALAGGLVAGDLYMVTGTDPRQVAIVF